MCVVSCLVCASVCCNVLACVITYCPFAYKSGLAPSFLSSALIHREASPKLLAAMKIETGVSNRGTGNEKVTFNTKVFLSDILRLEKRQTTVTDLGVVAGFPVHLTIKRTDQDTFGIFTFLLMPDVRGGSFSSCLGRGVGFDVSLQVRRVIGSIQRLFDGNVAYGWPDFLFKPWQEIVHEGSSYFPEGKMSVTVTLKKLTKDDK